MINFIRVAPPNSLILIEDPSGGELPESMRNSLVVATASCIAIGCMSEHDGETVVSLIAQEPINITEPKVFDGILETPNLKLSLRTIEGLVLLEHEVPTNKTRVKIWANDPIEPNDIKIHTM